MKLFSTNQIALIDNYTIINEPISSFDLMERASNSFFSIVENEIEENRIIYVFCGPGNNGGDGLAIARMLANSKNNNQVKVFILDFGKGLKGSAETNFYKLKEFKSVEIKFLKNSNDFPEINSNDIIIDSLFGSGLTRPLEGIAAELVRHINNFGVNVYAVDIPSGLMGENNTTNNPDYIVRANTTITFQFPKLSFLFSENEKYLGKWIVTDIGLHSEAILKTESIYYLTNKLVITGLLKKRSAFAHKGNFGHALLIAGAYGKMGAAVLGAKACLRSGVGLLTNHVPHMGYQIIQTAVPESMASIDDSELFFTGVSEIDKFDAIAIGPGIGQKVNTARGLKKLLTSTNKPLVLDADALNIIAEHKDWLMEIPQGSILTPHPKEFERLTAKVNDSYERMQLGINFAIKHKLNMVVKGAYTMVINENGEVWFNSTGNSGMATAGSGDVLTGIILGLLAQGYKSFDAARLGVFIHGLAGDVAASKCGVESLIASDIINNLGDAFKILNK